MAIKWKSKFRPEHVLKRVAAARTRTASGGSSFSGFEIETALPTLHSMLEFPRAAEDIDHADLIWRAAANDPGELTKDTFLKELNRQLTKALSKKIDVFHVLTSVSLRNDFLKGSTKLEGVEIIFRNRGFPRSHTAYRKKLILENRNEVRESPLSYSTIVLKVRAKTTSVAFAQAFRALDAHRAIWCLYSNPEMEILGRTWIPINVVRLGPAHTIHTPNGKPAVEAMWFEPHYIEASAYSPRDPEALRKVARRSLARIKRSAYSTDLISALVLYVRALDEWNQTTAFIRLWSALERLVSPGFGDYDAIVRRCSFLWSEVDFEMQTLEHLREYRNNFMHRGVESQHAKSYCFQLQRQFRAVVRFHVAHVGKFSSLEEANRFLDLPADLEKLKQLGETVERARRYRTPRPPAR